MTQKVSGPIRRMSALSKATVTTRFSLRLCSLTRRNPSVRQRALTITVLDEVPLWPSMLHWATTGTLMVPV